MICFEEFDIDSRYPVVLPCGHTYICNDCANRLDKCMECRTPLVEYMPRKGPAVGGAAAASGVSGVGTVRGRSGLYQTHGGGRGNAPAAAEPPRIKRRIPLPKNVVLMSLIEATEVAAENVQGQDHQPSLNESPMINPSVLDIEVDEEERIRASTTIAISDCGTYAVAAKDGLEIFPSRPESLLSPGGNNEPTEEDVDTLVRFFHMEHKLEMDALEAGGANGASHVGGSILDDDKKMDDDEPRKGGGGGAPPGRLSWGDRIQIVSTQNGWAKLARGYGFVRAGHNQLVKGECVVCLVPTWTLSCCL
jgi:Zinc finger, C3HC4 type (RING finger)